MELAENPVENIVSSVAGETTLSGMHAPIWPADEIRERAAELRAQAAELELEEARASLQEKRASLEEAHETINNLVLAVALLSRQDPPKTGDFAPTDLKEHHNKRQGNISKDTSPSSVMGVGHDGRNPYEIQAWAEHTRHVRRADGRAPERH